MIHPARVVEVLNMNYEEIKMKNEFQSKHNSRYGTGMLSEHGNYLFKLLISVIIWLILSGSRLLNTVWIDRDFNGKKKRITGTTKEEFIEEWNGDTWNQSTKWLDLLIYLWRLFSLT